ncbi:MAG TPA: NAD(P)-dependent oxidoreductase, partial [Thermoanaerobaculia bacterium]|nr:NAD(P)-dependent oxidoreductase [Thermoanaerobaculia bacterium]
PRRAAEGADIVLTMVSDDNALAAVCEGDDGLLAGLASGTVHAVMSTIAPATSERLSALHEERGIAYLAAPVFGRPDMARAAKLSIVTAGPEAARTRLAPVFSAIGQRVFAVGDEASAANVVKLAGNFMIAAAIEAMGEALALAEKHGIDREKAMEVYSSTLFACPIYQNYGAAIAAERFQPAGFRLALGLKDVSLVQQAARAKTVPMPLASLVADRLVASMARGRGDWDWAGLARAIAEDAGLPRDAT